MKQSMDSSHPQGAERTLEDVRTEIREIFYDVEELPQPPEYVDTRVNLEAIKFGGPVLGQIDTPPSYMAYLAFKLAGFTFFRYEDKSTWQAACRYRDKEFWVVDRKRSLFFIDGPDKHEETIKAAQSLRKKIECAAGLIDDRLRPELAKRVDNGQFYLYNSYHQLYRTYEHFLEAVKTDLDALDEAEQQAKQQPPVSAEEIPSLSEIMNEYSRPRWRLSSNAAACVGLFFSFSELLFDILFAFKSDRSSSLDDWLGPSMTWKERAKEVLPLEQPDFSDVHDKLLRIRESVRNPMFHGLGGDDAKLVILPNFGLVPMSYRLLNTAPHYGSFPVSTDQAREILDCFTDFERAIQANPRTRCALIYARSGLPIPFDENALKNLRPLLDSPGSFESYVTELQQRADYDRETYH